MRLVLGSCLVLCALLTTTPAAADHVRAALLVASPTDHALTERVRGQTSDLDAELVVHDVRTTAPTFEDRMREADVLARRDALQAVLWFRVAAGTVVVYASVPEQNRVLVRELGQAAGKPSSATLEAAALVVRDVLRALGQGATVGEPRDPPVARAEEPPALPLYTCTEPRCAAPSAPLAVAWPPNKSVPSFAASAGWQAARSRDAPYVVGAIDLRLGARYEWLAAALVLTLGTIDVERITERSDMLVRRHSLGLVSGATTSLSRDVSLTASLASGAVVFVHATRSLSPAFTPAATREHTRAFVGPEVRVAWSVAGPLALVASLGVDVIVNAPHFEVVEVPGRSAVYGLADVQPRLGLAVEWSSLKLR